MRTCRFRALLMQALGQRRRGARYSSDLKVYDIGFKKCFELNMAA